jgi:drug/metabolite transporter (DMT)-like permease
LNKKRLTAYCSLAATAAIWGVGTVVIKYSLNYTSPFSFLFLRFLIVDIIFIPVFIFLAVKNRLKLADLPLLTTLGFMATTLNLGLLFYGMKLTTANEAALLGILSTILIVIGGGIFLKEKITGLEKIGAGMAFSGSLFIIIEPFIKNGGQAFSGFTGNLLVLVGTLVWVSYSLLLRKHEAEGKKIDPLLLTSYSFIIGLITITPLYLLNRTAGESLFLYDPKALPGIIYMAIFGSCVAYFFYNLGFSLIPASEATLFNYLTPLISVPLAIFFLGESINCWFIGGALLIIIGVFLTEYKPEEKPNLVS